ncbi:MAG: tRNA uridine-5-carboxymethylaminomethyl(34) synthesis GTPase MnmE [Methylobacteriaceae bacterium]|nr:tRNA uridine-5-carboxymethylaminomethyl(34) synthesis GTPase MnmE [Methylobacteriaceae bacterium]
MQNDTIFAMATAPGRAAIAVCRMSGPGARDAVLRLAGRVPPPRRAQLSRLAHPVSGEAIDDALIFYFPAPRSYTGEDCAELQVHGGTAIARALIEALGALGLRAAEPGEFTRRAFLNGKLDLAQAEGVADLVDAETESQRRQALRQLEGRLSRQVESWRQSLLGIAARLEAELDFSDEGDLAELMMSNIVIDDIRQLTSEMREALWHARTGERLRDGLRIVIAGVPNAGKSSLLNALARRDVAIVSEHPGTTRDALEVHLDLAGYPVTVVDTAGLRDASDAVEQIGIGRAMQRAEAADLILWLVEPGSAALAPPRFGGSGDVWTIATKCDIAPPGWLPGTTPPAKLSLSAVTGAGLEQLEAALEGFARERLEIDVGVPALTRERHRQALAAAVEALQRIAADPGLPPEIVAEEIRVSQNAVGRIAGRIDIEDVLGEIFGRFCIGK